jgi:alkylated DNA nucleotide flippase Atl1
VEVVKDDYVELVLSAVERIPPGRVASYGDIAEVVGQGGPRQVGQVMALHGGAVAWWRVVRSDGRPARHHEEQALAQLTAESTPMTHGRIDMCSARFAFAGGDSKMDSPWGSQGP